jgi:hypothetical protein
MTTQELLADAVAASKGALTRFLTGFTDANRTAQAPHLPNHAIWTLGHVALYLHDAAGRIDGRPMPEKDIGPDAGSGHSRFANDAIGFGSKPANDPARYPTLARGVAIFEAACERLATAARRADGATLDRQTEWMGMQIPLGLLVTRLILHIGMHTGEIMDLRRALGLEPIFKG